MSDHQLSQPTAILAEKLNNANPGGSSCPYTPTSSASKTLVENPQVSNRPEDVQNAQTSVFQQEKVSDISAPFDLMAIGVAVEKDAEENEERTHSSEPSSDEENNGQGAETVESEVLLPFDERPSYTRIAKRLKKIRTLPTLAACLCSLAVTAGVSGTQLSLGAGDSSSGVSLLVCASLSYVLTVAAASSKSHVLLVGVVLLEILFTLYAVAFASVGFMNVNILKQKMAELEADASLQEEQRVNALKIVKKIFTDEIIFSSLYFIVAAAHCYAAVAANHLRAAVQPFDSRLRRKRQRARACEKLGVVIGKDLAYEKSGIKEETEEETAETEENTNEEGSKCMQEETQEEHQDELDYFSSHISEAGEQNEEKNNSNITGSKEHSAGSKMSSLIKNKSSEKSGRSNASFV